MQRGARSGARSVKAKGSSRVQSTGRTREGELVQAPVARSVAFAILGFVMLVAGIAALAPEPSGVTAGRPRPSRRAPGRALR